VTVSCKTGLSVAVAVLLAACSTSDTGTASDAAVNGEPAGAGFGHVHGLGVNPADGDLYVASHLGVHRVTDGTAERIADRYQDTMAFTVIGPDHFLASGHPDLREDMPPHLGLIESTDGAQTWQSLSLLGQADFHAIEVATDRTYAYDALSGDLLVSTDRRSWETRASIDVGDMAANPGNPAVLVVTTTNGRVMRSVDSGATFETVPDTPPLLFVDWPVAGPVVAVDVAGVVHVSDDNADTWRRVGRLPDEPTAFRTAGERWYAASDAAVWTSADGGATWSDVLGSS